ncbi:MAG: MmgE/PrpD family protein [Dehalococcoidia bacterium]|nr:MAG: MmgE/PrpD family protein [Dehalococcoidia bacterium]
MSPTDRLAAFIVQTDRTVIPAHVMHEAKRTLINVLAVALATSEDPSVDTLDVWGGTKGMASVIGRGSASEGQAALVNGYLAHLQDYDDTHFPTVLHPSAPTWPAVLAAAERTGASGAETLAAFAIGCEVACRVALSVHPWHYDAGWHITGTVGGFGAAAGTARLLGLDVADTTQALGVAGTHAAGVREAFGTNGKALHAGHAASNGLRAASLVSMGFSGPKAILEGRRGFWAVLSPGGHNGAPIEGLDDLIASGVRWELQNNGLKPYANGVVSHPLQDAVIELRNKHAIVAGDVRAIEARVHPLVLELMDRPQPETGLSAKFSHQHCAAAALIDGAGHEAQFHDDRARDPQIAAVRALVHATPDAALGEDEVHVTIRMADGRALATHVEHATGSPENPMSDAHLEAKYRALATPVLGERDAEALLRAAWTLDQAPDIRALMALASRRTDG